MRYATQVLWSMALLIALPGAYLLSIGPAAYLTTRHWISFETYRAYVSPLAILAPEGTSRNACLVWYAHLWQ